MQMRYLSVCSGIEAATCAWEPLGWKPWAFSQFDPEHKYKGGPDFPSAVLATHYSDVPNLGDMTKFEEWPDAIFDVLAGGTPCQSYSVAGLRAGLDDPRGDLMLTYVAIARRYRPRWVAWENVPGVLSDDKGRSFGTLLGLLTGRRVEVPSGGWETAGAIEGYKGAYGIAWRVIDSQFVRVDGFGRAVPQRRRRVFVVGYLGDWRRAAAVLFEREGVCGNSPPRRQPWKGVAPTISARTKGGGGLGTDFDLDGGLVEADVSMTLSAACGAAAANATDLETYIPVADYVPDIVSQAMSAKWSKGSSGPAGDEVANLVASAFSFEPSYFTREKDGASADVFPPLSADADKGDQDAVICQPIPIDMRQASRGATMTNNRREGSSGGAPGTGVGEAGDPSPTIASSHVPAVAFDSKASGRNGFGVGEISPTLRAMASGKSHPNGGGQVAVAFQPRFARNGRGAPDEIASALTGEAGRTGKGDSAQCVAYLGTAWRVRRLTPTECERLQGFPDGYTNIPWRGKNSAPDGPRYKALGNSMSVNVMRWLGRRIEMVEEIFAQAA